TTSSSTTNDAITRVVEWNDKMEIEFFRAVIKNRPVDIAKEFNSNSPVKCSISELWERFGLYFNIQKLEELEHEFDGDDNDNDQEESSLFEFNLPMDEYHNLIAENRKAGGSSRGESPSPSYIKGQRGRKGHSRTSSLTVSLESSPEPEETKKPRRTRITRKSDISLENNKTLNKRMDNPGIMDPSASLLKITTITTTINTTIPSDSNATLSISQNLSQEATSEPPEPPEPLDITSNPGSTTNFTFTQNQQQFGPNFNVSNDTTTDTTFTNTSTIVPPLEASNIDDTSIITTTTSLPPSSSFSSQQTQYTVSSNPLTSLLKSFYPSSSSVTTITTTSGLKKVLFGQFSIPQNIEESQQPTIFQTTSETVDITTQDINLDTTKDTKQSSTLSSTIIPSSSTTLTNTTITTTTTTTAATNDANSNNNNKPLFTYKNPFDLFKQQSPPPSPTSSTSNPDQQQFNSSWFSSHKKNETQSSSSSSQKESGGMLPKPLHSVETHLSSYSAWNVRAVSKLKQQSNFPDGVRLPRGVLLYDTGNRNENVLCTKDLDLTTITLVLNELEYRSGKLIASQDKSIIDLCIHHVPYEPKDADNDKSFKYLLLVLGESRITIWELSLSSGGSDSEILSKLLLEIDGKALMEDNNNQPRFHRAIWHTVNPNIFAVVVDFNDVWIINIAKILSINNKPSNVKVNETDIADYVLKTGKYGKLISDLAFSPDGSTLATANDDSVIFWKSNFNMNDVTSNDDNSDEFSNGNLDPIKKIILDGQQVSSVLFVDDSDDNSNTTLEHNNSSSSNFRYVVLGTELNTNLHLYDVETAQYIQSIKFLPPPPERHAFSTKKSSNSRNKEEQPMFNCIGYERTNRTLLVGNSARVSIFALRLNLPSRKKLDSSSFDDSVQFNYMIEFPVGQLIGNFVVIPDATSGNGVLTFCTQTKAVQQYHIRNELLLPNNFKECPEFVNEEETITNDVDKKDIGDNNTIAKLKDKKKATSSSNQNVIEFPSDPERTTTRRKEQHAKSSSKKGDNITTTNKSGGGGGNDNNSSKSKKTEENSRNSGVQMQPFLKEIKKMEDTVSNKLGKLFSKELEKQFQKIEEDRIAHQAAETSRQETILKVVSQTLSTNTAKLLETTVRNEIQINVLPSLSKMVNSAIDKHVHRGITEAMNKSIPNTIEKSISDQIQRMLAKNAVIEPIAKGVSKTIKPVIEENFRDYFENIIVPTFEKSTNSMFDQITSMLESGLRDISISTTTPQSSSTTVLHDQNATNNITRLQTSVDHLTLQVQQLQQFLQSQQLITNLTTRHIVIP
ncbi:23271_t:CDS:10, partial [Entrophospora sp. SA101]